MIIRTDSSSWGAWPEDTSESLALVVNPLPNWWSYALTLELSMRLKADGHEVKYLDLASLLPDTLQVNSKDSLRRWRYKNPKGRVAAYLSNCEIDVVSPFFPGQAQYLKPDFGSLEDLRSWTYEGKPFGRVIAAAISGKVMQMNFDVTSNSNLIREHVNSAIRASEAVRSCIEGLKPDLVCSVNDRILAAGISLLEAKSSGLQTLVSYWGSDVRKFVTYQHSLYSSAEWRNLIHEKWTAHPPTPLELSSLDVELSNLATVGMAHSESFRPSITTPIDAIPHERQKSIVFFASTPWEFSGLTEHPEGNFLDQVEAVRAILELLDANLWTVIVRHHPPRLGEVSRAELESWQSLRRYTNFIEVMPDSPIDSYDLLQHSDLNAVWVSTIGAEAIARGRPTLVLGEPYWLDPEWSCAAQDGASLGRFLSRSPSNLEPNLLLPYLFYFKDFGASFRFISGVGPEQVMAGGKLLYPRTIIGSFVSLLLKLRKFAIFRGMRS